MSRIGEWVLHRLCRPLPPDTNPWTPRGKTEQLAWFKGKFNRPIEPYLPGDVLEIGSGNGILAEGLRPICGGRVVASDYWASFPEMLDKCVTDRTGIDFVRADARALPFPDRMFDTVISEDGFEHFINPEKALAEVFRVLKHDGILLVTFGPPWYSPRGGHMMFLNPPPWFHLVFSERTVFDVRARYRSDGVGHWTEGYSTINKLSVARFRRSARALGLAPEEEKLWPVRGINALVRFPGLRELFCNLYAGVWRK
jgi:ubiquinone/menaquinone biosynthesis C-methylase UbiE